MPAASTQDVANQAALFAALADPTRLKLFSLLCRQRHPDALCVNALAQRLGVTQSAVSQHLRVLRGTDLVKGERRGYHVHYFVNRVTLERCRDIVAALAAAGEPAAATEPCEGSCPMRREEDVPAS